MQRFDDRVFREKSREWRQAGVGQRTDQHGGVGDRHVFGEAAHLAHVLLVMHGDNHRTRAEEQHRLEESVREQVEDRRRVGGSAQRNWVI